MTVDQKHLNSIAEAYHLDENCEDKFIEDIQQKYSWKIMKQFIKDGEDVLEMGIGEGIILDLLSKNNNFVTVLEGSNFLTEKAQLKYAGNNKINIVCKLFEDYTPQAKYDCILANHVLEHIDDPNKLLFKMRTWLKPNGRIFAIVPNADSIHRKLGVHMKLQKKSNELSARDLKVGHQRVYSFAELSEEFNKAGMIVTQSGGYFPKFFSNGMMVDFSPQMIEAYLDMSPIFPKELLANLWVVAK